MSVRRLAVLTVLSLPVSCGARDTLLGAAAPQGAGGAFPSGSGGGAGGASMAGGGGASTAGPGAGGTPTAAVDASTRLDAGSLRDASPDVIAIPDAAAPDAPRPEAGPFASCTCPPGDYFLEGDLGGAPLALTAPYRLSVYCEEETVLLLRHPCTDLYRLSGCGADGSPCLYVVIDRATGSAYGHLVDDDSVTWSLVSGELLPEPPSGQLATGTLTATFRHPDQAAEQPLTATYRACLARTRDCTSE